MLTACEEEKTHVSYQQPKLLEGYWNQTPHRLLQAQQRASSRVGKRLPLLVLRGAVSRPDSAVGPLCAYEVASSSSVVRRLAQVEEEP